ncbi:MAG TPA: hypothetical protein VHG08_14780 [Longimicrobium sp.]|nr:hypothetical protein [Longimicrobium sp.]
MPGAPPHTVRGYQLSPPTEQDALTFLARALGADRAATLWMRTCRETGVRAGALSLDELERVVQALAKEEGPAGVVGSSLAIRLRSYRLLAAARGTEGKEGR